MQRPGRTSTNGAIGLDNSFSSEVNFSRKEPIMMLYQCFNNRRLDTSVLHVDSTEEEEEENKSKKSRAANNSRSTDNDRSKLGIDRTNP